MRSTTVARSSARPPGRCSAGRAARSPRRRGSDHLAEDEQDQQREREEREREVVGDHRRQAGDVLAVGALPEHAQEPGRAASRGGAGPRTVSFAPSSPAGPRARGWRADAERRRLGCDATPAQAIPRARRAPRRPAPVGAVRSRLRRGSGRGLRRCARLRLRAAWPSASPPWPSRRSGSAAAALAAPRRGLRVPGSRSGRLPKTPALRRRSGWPRRRPGSSCPYSIAIAGRRFVLRRNRGRVAALQCRRAPQARPAAPERACKAATDP